MKWRGFEHAALHAYWQLNVPFNWHVTLIDTVAFK